MYKKGKKYNENYGIFMELIMKINLFYINVRLMLCVKQRTSETYKLPLLRIYNMELEIVKFLT